MIRQAQTYLFGALSGVVVIGIAIAAFVVLVSAQVFHDLPIPALSSSDQNAAAVSPAKAVNGSADGGAVASTGPANAPTGQSNPAPSNSGGPTGAAGPVDGNRRQRGDATPTRDATGPAEVVETAPTTTSTGTGDDEGSSTSGGKTGGSKKTQPSSNTQQPSPSNSGSNGGSSGGNSSNSSSGTSGGSGGSSSSSPTTTSGSSSSGSPSTGTSGGGSTTTTPPATPVTTAKPSEAVTEAVNGTVGTVDEALGGTLSETGVTKVTEELVEGVAGPESVVGKTVDGVGEVVGGLVGGNGH